MNVHWVKDDETVTKTLKRDVDAQKNMMKKLSICIAATSEESYWFNNLK